MVGRLVAIMLLTFWGSACAMEEAEEPEGSPAPGLAQPRTHLTLDQLRADDTLPLVDMSFFARPDWAQGEPAPFSGTISLAETPMTYPMEQEPYQGETTFPAFTAGFIANDGKLIPRQEGIIDTGRPGHNYWNAILGTGAVWREPGDEGWSRASFPINMIDRWVGQVRNCVGTFVYRAEEISSVHVQCSQETAVLDAGQVGDIHVAVPAAYTPETFADSEAFLAAHERFMARRLPTAPLSEIDERGRIAAYFDKSLWTSASTSLGAVWLDGTLYVHPPKTRHGLYPYPDEMRHGVFSVTKSMAAGLAMFYFAERYGDEIFDTEIVDYVPAFAGLPEWEGVTFFHLLNMTTGTRAGEDLLFEPLELAPGAETAIRNIAEFGDFPEAPGETFNYATTNTFVLSYALQNYVEAREGEGVRYWDLLHENVLEPIGAEDFRVLHTRTDDGSEPLPILGLSAFPNLDDAAKIALLFANEGEYEGRQLLSRARLREAFGHTDWQGYATRNFYSKRYRHSLWSKPVQAGFCRVQVNFMLGLGANYVLFLPSGALVFRFMEEQDMNIDPLVRAVEQVRSSCR